MTLEPSTLAIIAGILALLFAAVTIHAARAVTTEPPIASTPIDPESVKRFGVPNIFVPILFGVLSLGFSEPLVTTQLGIALCFGMGIYFGLRGWAYARSPELRAAGPYIGTYLVFVASSCYLAAAIIASVI